MGLNPQQFLEHVIRPTLALLPEPMRRRAAERLLMDTAAHEGDGFQALAQYQGSARGPFQMESVTHDSLMLWVEKQPALLAVVHLVAVAEPRPGHYYASADQMAWNLRYAVLMARLYYWTHPDPLPPADDLPALAGHWHKAWCRGCKGTPDRWLRNYARHITARHVAV